MAMTAVGFARFVEERRCCGFLRYRPIRSGGCGGLGWARRLLGHPIGHPLVYADWLHPCGARGGWTAKPTVLCYGHYDVQPAEPLEEWRSPPFEPEVRDGNVYARGAVDDKGQMWMHVKALESMMAAGGGRCR